MLQAAVLGLLAAALLAVHLTLARRRWSETTRRRRARLREASASGGAFDPAVLRDLPTPVVRYLRAAIGEGAPLVRQVRVVQRGTFLVRPGENGWRPFTATEDLAACPPGFLWDARIRMAPAVTAYVRDGFLDGDGFMRAAIPGVATMVDAAGTPGIASASLVRWLGEAVWCPPALLPSDGLRWEAIDDRSARATATAGAVAAFLEFRFGEDGLVRSVYAPARGRDVKGVTVPTPWQGRWSEYRRHAGMLVPTVGEVEWLLPEGPRVYWRGRAVSFVHEPFRGA